MPALPIIVRSPESKKQDDRVALISGGGSGHEPAHAGYVGTGMLDAAVLGPVFTSPSVDNVYAAIVATATKTGALLIVKNYTGDRLNFGLAAEMARVEGIPVEMIIVADDAALGDSSGAGRRGLTATVLVHKIAGAAAERGWPPAQIVAAVERLLAGTATMGVALGPCYLPGATAPNFALGDTEIEWGLGIHGEAGSELGEIARSADIAERLVDTIVADRGLSAGTDVVALINSLGGTPDLDLRILQGDVLAALAARDLRVHMTWAGPFLTSLEMPGASLTVATVDAELLELLADDARVVAFPQTTPLLGPSGAVTVAAPELFEADTDGGASSPDVAEIHEFTEAIADALINAESELTDLDRQVGDGDLGTNLARGAKAVCAASARLYTQPDAARYLTAVSDIVRREVGGTSGPLYSLLLLAMAERLAGIDGAPSPADWSAALGDGSARVQVVGGAAPGDSTMIDALHPAAQSLAAAGGASAKQRTVDAADAARSGATSTATLKPSLGRSSYVGDRAIGIPDPGAVAVALQFEALARALALSGTSTNGTAR
ncbi:dihydroxyacetone kinase [Arthrobacter sp. V4I6]|uniref:dihydroxyacetone kinase family protein n=1 Tax=Arthrobacter sp. V4I6 TaxID=3042281 RepID=UPI0027828CA7|nr:dihydroxyacetone kinase family protein [Arthrobacter sp. V4I6]MDQ0855703.1 dihydroxyacetone kinase [Arthrobacter sp. V4I6]